MMLLLFFVLLGFLESHYTAFGNFYLLLNAGDYRFLSHQISTPSQVFTGVVIRLNAQLLLLRHHR